MRSILWMCAAMVWATSAPLAGAAHALDWTAYQNSRFGLQMRYPADIFSEQQTSEARDGDLFATRDGSAKLLVGAFENSERHSPASYQRLIARESYPGLHVDYAPVGQRWSVLSGTLGDTMVYEKIMFSCAGRVINSFAIVYPVAERQLYDPIVEAIEDSFRPGASGCDDHAARF
jgi:hypothetical protein